MDNEGSDRIVAAGVLVDRDAHIVITTEHRDISGVRLQVSPANLQQALMPLTTRRELVAVFHNAVFDVSMLERAGIPVNCVVHDTMKLLKLYDSDRGREKDDGTGVGGHLPRYERRYRESLNYKLKDVTRHVLDIQAIDFPGDPVTLHAADLIRYLKSDLLATRELYSFLQRRLRRKYWDYNSNFIATVTPILVRMSVSGMLADAMFVQRETERLLQIMSEASTLHERKFGQRLDVGDFYLRSWVYYHGLRCRRIYSGKKRQLSLRTSHLLELRDEERAPIKRESLGLIHDYKLAQSLMVRLRSLERHIDRHTSRIYSTFNDFQSSGRVSSTKPNLQQIAGVVAAGKKKEFVSETFGDLVVRSRSALVASPG